MKLHILGIGGTFMGGLALIAREAGHRVSGTDAAVYPPMSTQLQEQGITVHEGYDPDHLAQQMERDLDCVVIGNALSRGNPMVEHVLDSGVPYTSGPRWLAENVLSGKRVLAVAGTHGKTTTASLLAWILEHAGKQPGFLIGGVPDNFGVSARLGGAHLADGDCFVIEADEYDTAFFDKRAKFVHYAPEVAVLNNLEFDHADIYPDLAAIQRQFHHLLRIVPGNGRVICNARDKALRAVLDMGCWTPVQWFDPDVGAGSGGGLDVEWSVTHAEADGSRWTVKHGDETAQVRWLLTGLHNVANGLAAIAGAGACDVGLEAAAEALTEFRGVRRRLEVLSRAGEVTVYDDFAHHPTEIRATLSGLRARVGDARIVAAFEPRSNSMRLGVHAQTLAGSLADADRVLILGREDLQWNPARLAEALGDRGTVVSNVDELVDRLGDEVKSGDHVIFLSNGSFDGAPGRFVVALEALESADAD